MTKRYLVAASILLFTASTEAASNNRLMIESGAHLEFVNTVPKAVTYRGRKALRLTAPPDNGAVALIDGSDFQDGTIEVDLAGLPGAGASDTARGFVGVAFRSTAHAAAYDCFYLRPTNGRADDQLRRNHATQYVSEPDFPWQKLRAEAPGVYESYADLETGGWTHVRIEVSGTHARLFVNRAPQPALVVNDLKRGTTRGQIALWIGPGTEAHFRNLTLASK
jgi:3-keto-disaccharide hydrolase